jgi:hypothetical protein
VLVLKDEENLSQGGHPLSAEPCIYAKKHEGEWNYIPAYVDDLLVFASAPERITQIKDNLAKHLDIRDLGQIRRFLGVSHCLKRTTSANWLSGLIWPSANRISSSQIWTHDLSAEPVDEHFNSRPIIGALLFIANMGRPDISSAVS